MCVIVFLCNCCRPIWFVFDRFPPNLSRERSSTILKSPAVIFLFLCRNFWKFLKNLLFNNLVLDEGFMKAFIFDI